MGVKTEPTQVQPTEKMTTGDGDDVEIIADISRGDQQQATAAVPPSLDKFLNIPLSKEAYIEKYKKLCLSKNSLGTKKIVLDCDLTKVVAQSARIKNVQALMLFKTKEVGTRLHAVEESNKEFVSLCEKFEHDLKAAALIRPPNKPLHRPNSEAKDENAVYNNNCIRNGIHPDVQQGMRPNQVGPHPHLNYARARTGLSKFATITDASGEVIHVGQVALQRPNLPAHGPVKRKELVCGMKVLAMKTNYFGVWVRATVIAAKRNGPESQYKVRFDQSKTNIPKFYTAKQLAYDKPPDVILPVGSRVVAHYRPEDSSSARSSLYAGIIAEPPKNMNRYRYLVFFDDGYAQYVKHTEVYLVCAASKDVWEDIHPDARDFVKGYLMQYPERPMVKLQKDQVIKTEWNGQWWSARVMAIDASMVKMFFDADQRTEWIYRGSRRLGPLFNELENAAANRLSGKNRRHNILIRKPHQPYVEYTRGLDEPVNRQSDMSEKSIQDEKKYPDIARPTLNGTPRNVAKKSTTQEKKDYVAYERQLIQLGELKSQIGYKETETFNRSRIQYKAHYNCTESCRNGDDDPSKHKGKNPLLIPTYEGWERHITKHRGTGKQVVLYRAPCGRRLRNVEDVNTYLLKTKSKLTVDLFTFDCYVHIFETFKPKEPLILIEDITYGKENVPVPCVNNLEKESPPYVEYSAERFPGKGVHLNLDPEFLCGCDCTDNCQDRDRCQCQQLTISATEVVSKQGRIPDAGYKFRRLHESIVTGVYECNPRCSCSRSCLNRVVQNGLQVRLQMFKTERRGWGIRCLDDIPQGMFLCIYAGQLLTEQGADEDGNQFGDEYLAELDHIDVVEKLKEGYESDVVEENGGEESDTKDSTLGSDEDSNMTNSSAGLQGNDSDSDFDPSVRTTASTNRYDTRSKNKTKKKKKLSKNWLESVACIALSDDESSQSNNVSPAGSLPDLDHPPGFKSVHTKKSQNMGPMNPPLPLSQKKSAQKTSFMPIRSYFSEEYCYIMDAKSKGNIGRYLNHSCNPNVFVQNVFVDTHDLRFPWVAFFAATYIQAGTELTWDYNYDVDSVPGKVMYCYCGSEECRGRLL